MTEWIESRFQGGLWLQGTDAKRDEWQIWYLGSHHLLSIPENLRSHAGWVTAWFLSWSGAEAKVETAFSPLPDAGASGTHDVWLDFKVPILPTFPLSLVSALRINILITLFIRFFQGKDLAVGTRLQMVFQELREARLFCILSSQGIREKMWVTELLQCTEEFWHFL